MMFLLAVIILFATLAMLMPQGMWTSAIALVNVTTAALLAINFWEPIVTWVEGMGPFARRSTYVLDFVVIWLLFAFILTILRAVTDLLSKSKLRFIRPLDVAGGAFFGLWTGWVLVCFTLMTLHMAPLSREFLFGSFQPEKRMVLGLAPDRQMLGFMQSISLGAFSRGGDEQYVFDPKGEYMLKYASRRKEYETVAGLVVPEKQPGVP
jgi:uncharacterized membrane protein required for colicin V production